MKKITLLKTLMLAVCLLVGGSAWADVPTYTWDFTNTTTWTTAKVTTGSAVTLNPSAATPGEGEYGVTFTFSNSLSLADGSTAAGQVKWNAASNSVSGTGLWFAAGGSTTTNNVSITLPAGFKVTFYLIGGASSRKWKYTSDGGTTTTNYETSTALSYKNETSSDVTFILWADNPYKYNGNKLQLQNGISSIVLEDLSAVAKHSWSVKCVIKNTSTQIDSWDGATLNEGEEYYVWGKKVISYGGKFYELDDTKFTDGKIYFDTTMETADVVHEISYTLNENIVAYDEIGTGIAKYSDGGYTNDNSKHVEVNLDKGVYEVGIKVVSNGSAGSNHRHENLYVGGEVVYTTDNTDALLTQRFIVSADNTNVYVQGAGSSGYGDNLDYVIIRKIDLSAETAAFNALKDYANALVAVDNDNASANSTLSTAISTQAAAVAAATTAEAITTATNTLKTAMLTYIGAANPTGANEFDLEFMIVNPGMEVDGVLEGWQHAVTGWSRCATVTNYRPIVITSFTNTSGAFTGTCAYENWHGDGLAGQMKQTISDMPDGVYKVQLGVFVGSLNGQFAYAKSNGVTYKYPLTVGNATEDATIYVPVTGGSLEIGLDMNGAGVAWAAIDNARIHKVNYAVSKTISAAGWATYCSPYALDFSSAIANLDAAYLITSGDGTYVTTEEITGTIPANTGILLKGEGMVTIPVVANSSTNVSSNKLIGVTTATTLDLDDNDDGTADTQIYVLLNETTGEKRGIGFYLTETSVTSFSLGANTAYLPSNFAGGSTRSFFSLWNDETTSISEKVRVNSDKFATAPVFNLNGQRIEKPAKGLYIQNGKKIIVK